MKHTPTAADSSSELTLSDLVVENQDGQRIVDGVHLSVVQGGSHGLVGESGSGKTITLRAMMGLLPAGLRVTSGKLYLEGREYDLADPSHTLALRGQVLSMVFQEPAVALNPLMTVGKQISDGAESLNDVSAAEGRKLALKLLQQVGIADPERTAEDYPAQLSGGMRQRAMIAAAVAARPKVLLCDEPTTALDVTVQRQVVDLLEQLRRQTNVTLIYVSHDLALVSEMCESISVMRSGRILEENPVERLFEDPKTDYTRKLISATPRLDGETRDPTEHTDAQPLLSVENLCVDYAVRNSRHRTTRVVREVNLNLRAGETHALVGESGSGKSTIARCILGLLPPAAGSLTFAGEELPVQRTPAQLRGIQMVFQDPFASLNPTRSIGAILQELLQVNRITKREHQRDRAVELLELCQLDASFLDRRPGTLSGGQRQRVAIARALAVEPRLLVADEPTSALDVSVQAEIIELFEVLRDQLQLSMLFISHDLAIVRKLSENVTVLQHGQIMEQGSVRSVFTHPTSEYTASLLAAVPRMPQSVR